MGRGNRRTGTVQHTKQLGACEAKKKKQTKRNGEKKINH